MLAASDSFTKYIGQLHDMAVRYDLSDKITATTAPSSRSGGRSSEADESPILSPKVFTKNLKNIIEGTNR